MEGPERGRRDGLLAPQVRLVAGLDTLSGFLVKPLPHPAGPPSVLLLVLPPKHLLTLFLLLFFLSFHSTHSLLRAPYAAAHVESLFTESACLSTSGYARVYAVQSLRILRRCAR